MNRVFILGLVFFAGCTQPEKSDYHEIRCKSYPNRCHKIARGLCPDGYVVTNRVRGQRTKAGTQYVLKVRCRNENFR